MNTNVVHLQRGKHRICRVAQSSIWAAFCISLKQRESFLVRSDLGRKICLIEAVRWRIQAGFKRLGQERIRPRVLFVVSTETGGTPQTNRDLMAALADRYDA